MGGKAKAKAATASDAPMEPMIAKGNADNTVKAQVNHLKIGNLFLEHAGAVNEGRRQVCEHRVLGQIHRRALCLPRRHAPGALAGWISALAYVRASVGTLITTDYH